MRVLVTGGTGFVGSRSVKALVDAGHEVRLLVRSPDRIAPALRPYGLDDREHVVGDVTDPGAVERALDGPSTPCAAGCRCCLRARCRSRTCATSPRCTRPCSSGLPINFEGPWLTANAGRMDASATERDLGVRFRPPAKSLADTYQDRRTPHQQFEADEADALQARRNMIGTMGVVPSAGLGVNRWSGA